MFLTLVQSFEMMDLKREVKVGMIETLTSKCVTPGCLGWLEGQIKGGCRFRYDVPHDGVMSPGEAQDVNAVTLSCEACGAEARVEAVIPETVPVRLVDIVVGDTTRTTPVENLTIKVYTPEQWIESYGHLKAQRIKPSREEYLDHMRKAGIDGDKPVKFHYKSGGLYYEGSVYLTFKENK